MSNAVFYKTPNHVEKTSKVDHRGAENTGRASSSVCGGAHPLVSGRVRPLVPGGAHPLVSGGQAFRNC